jgi:hypothetical protein
VLQPDQARLTGEVGSLAGFDAVAPPIPLPVIITVAQRGQGGLVISGVSVNGQPGTIAWSAGQPLPLSGTGALDLGPATLTADAGGVTWSLDGASRSLTSGHYVAGAPVAVGHAGLAEPHDTLSFDAGPAAGMNTDGGARIHLPPTDLDLTGPGSIQVRGSFSVQTATGTRHASSVSFGPGPFEVHLQPGLDGYVINALLQGPLTAA